SSRWTSAASGPRRAQATIASTAARGPWTTASTVPSRRLRTHPATRRRCASWRMPSRNHTPCTRPCATRRSVRGVSLIVGHPAARALGAPHQLLLLDAALLRGAAGARGHALLRHVVQAREALDQALERGLAVAVLGR